MARTRTCEQGEPTPEVDSVADPQLIEGLTLGHQVREDTTRQGVQRGRPGGIVAGTALDGGVAPN